ncbi:3-ketosteroid reductase [Microdochium trichocladiopsis]|uniref:3-ketosteroid reductase n=1 Tax=Microdochium trichocladiopsis TaxID=1682393 RepID=A0A9P8Y2A9_9PEZI|nr:3-ketosteroid reductase [Microdochium trichocladiopsis]KAH7027885.1 3-ketosteroid reductase [Microdochium trichocladiopsis]
MTEAPWAGVNPSDLHIILVTGANSGVGLGISQRLIDDFLSTKPLSSHLILLPTTRSARKSSETIYALREYLHGAATTSPKARAHAGINYDPEDAIGRVHILSVQVDLCDLHSIYTAADQLVYGTISDPTGVLPDVKIPKLDAALFNAGIGGWSGLNWFGLFGQILRRGIPQATTYPTFKLAYPTVMLDTKKLLGPVEAKTEPPPLAEVFTANTFGHYLLAHELMPLLSRNDVREEPGRIVFTSSIDAEHEHLSFKYFQAERETPPYESSKRITDVITLTATLPSVEPLTRQFFQVPESSSSTTSKKNPTVRPKLYVTHPGIVCTPIFPLNFVLFFFYRLTMYVARMLGSPWHVVTTYLGGCAAAWLGLESQSVLDAQSAHLAKWGSAIAPFGGGGAQPKMSEVDGWGWQGEIENADALAAEPATGMQRKLKGRKWDAVTLTPERREQFEQDGRACWTELERLRGEWERALGRTPGDHLPAKQHKI